MSALVKVRAVIWVDDLIAVHKVNRRGSLHVTLPGGRVNDRESVTDALRREVLEELGIEVNVGDLMFAAEVVSGARRQDIELVFSAQLVNPSDQTSLDLVDPQDPGLTVLPPVLDYLAAWRAGTLRYRWLGNIYTSQAIPLSSASEE